MKKVVKWTLFGLVLCGIVALSLCYIIIPERTKAAIDVVINYVNTPLGIACGTTITIGTVIGVIIRLVYDRYKDSVRSDFAKAKKFVEEQKNEAKEYYDQLLKYKQEALDILEAYTSEINFLKDELVEVCNTSPNSKIKALGEKINNGINNIQETLKDNLEKVENDFASAIEEHDTVKELEDKVNYLNEMLERLVANNETEETIDSNPKEE